MYFLKLEVVYMPFSVLEVPNPLKSDGVPLYCAVCTLSRCDTACVHVAVNVLDVTLPYASKSKRCAPIAEECNVHTCEPSEAVCILLLMFCMLLFHTQTGVPIAEECSVYLLNKLLAAACLLQVREADRLID